MKYVYMVLFDWSTAEADDIEIELFADYGDAKAYYDEIISYEKNPNISRIGEKAFDKNGNKNAGYIFKEEDYGFGANACWCVTNENDYYKHSFIFLEKKEINGGNIGEQQ